MDLIDGKPALFALTLQSLILTKALGWLHLLRQHLSLSHFHTAYRILTTIQSYTTYTVTYLSALSASLSGSTSPSLISIALLVVILFLSLQMLNMLWKWLKWWVYMAGKIAFYGGLIVLGLWLWSRGPDGFVADVEHLVGYFLMEYQYYKRQAEQANVEAKMRSRRRERWYY